MIDKYLQSCPWPACVFDNTGAVLHTNEPLQAEWDRWEKGAEDARHAVETLLKKLLDNVGREPLNQTISDVAGAQETQPEPRDQAAWLNREIINVQGKSYLLVVLPVENSAADRSIQNGTGPFRIAVWFHLAHADQAQKASAVLDETALHLDIAHRSLDVRNRLLNMISQEMRTSLNSIIGFTEILQHRLRAGETKAAERLAQPIIESARGTLQQLARLGKQIEREADGPITSTFDAGAMIADIIDHALEIAPDKSVNWSVHVEDEAKTVLSDPLYVRLIISQIMRQALLVAAEGSGIKVNASIEVKNGLTTLMVAVTNEEYGPIRVQPSSLNPLAQEFVTVLRGEIGCIPIGAKAATCYLRLPVLVPAASAQPDSSEPPCEEAEDAMSSPRGDEPVVVIVDGDDFNRSIVSAMIHGSESSYVLRALCSLDTARKAIQDDHADVVLVGLRTPGMADKKALAALKNEADRNGVQVIATINALGMTSEKDLDHLGFDRVLLKPLKKEDLLKALEEAITSKNKREEQVDMDRTLSSHAEPSSRLEH